LYQGQNQKNVQDVTKKVLIKAKKDHIKNTTDRDVDNYPTLW
jgi:hypothetical protein